MADNTELSVGSGGDVIATDDIAGVKYQRVKISVGADGAAADNSTASPLAVKISDGTDVALVDGSGNLNVVVAAGTNNIGDVDVLSVVPGTGATALGKAIDSVVGATDTGVAVLALRDDALSGLTPAEGDYVPFRTDANGAIWVIPSGTITVAAHAVTNAGTFVVQVDGAALTALQLIDDTVFAEDVAAQAADKGISVLAVRRDTASTMVGADNDYTNLIVDGSGRLHVNVGNTVTVAAHAVTNAGTFAVQVDGNALTALQLIDNLVLLEDAAHQTGDPGVQMLAVRDDTLDVRSGAENDYEPLHTNANGALWSIDVNSAAMLTALQLIDNPVLVDDAAFTPATSSVMMAGFEADEASTDSVDEGDAGAARMTLTRKLITTPQPHTTGGLLIFKSIDIDESEEEVKATAGQVYNIAAFNHTAAPLFLKFYNLTAANTTVGTSTPVLTFTVPANADSDGAGIVMMSNYGWAFDTAISVAATTAIADADTGAPAANACSVMIGYL